MYGRKVGWLELLEIAILNPGEVIDWVVKRLVERIGDIWKK